MLCAPSSNWMHLWVLLCFYLIGKRNLGGISGVLGPPSRLTVKITEGSRGQKKVFFSTEYKQFLACIYIKGPLWHSRNAPHNQNRVQFELRRAI